MNLRRAAAALLLPLLLATTWPVAGVVAIRPGGGGHGGATAPHATAPPPGADAAGGGPGARHADAAHGTQGSTGARPGGQRAPDPDLLRAAARPAAGTAHGHAQEEADAATRAQAAQEQAAHFGPWASAPHLHVRLTGDPVIDAANLKRLNAELATPIDPDRVRAGSLADDALADDLLARQAPRRPSDAQRALWRFLRDHPPHFDLYHLTDALRPLQGDTLLVMGHIDHSDGALVFKADNGRPLRLPLAVFEQASRDAGVHLLFVGCKSARHASAGFLDNLNSLDAARAMARAMHVRPSTLFDLYAALSGPKRDIQFDPAMFFASRVAEVTAGPAGAVVSTVHWSGPHGPAAASAVAAAEPVPPQAEAPPPPAWLSNPALLWLALALLLSWLVGLAVWWWHGQRGASLLGLVAIEAQAHLLLSPVLLTMFAEAVDGAKATWWAGGTAGVLALVALTGGWAAFGPRDSAAIPASTVARGLLACRLGVLALPFTAVALLHTGWLAWPSPVMGGLLALYSLGQPLPGPWLMAGGAFLLYWLAGLVVMPVQALQRWEAGRRARRGRAALWRDQLVADGVRGAAAQAAVAARLAFDQRCTRPAPWVLRWDQTKPLTDGHAPDPWAGLPRRHWRLVAVPLVPLAGQVDPQAAFGLIRVGSPFMHPLPPVLLQRLRAQTLRFEALPPLLAQVEPRLHWADFAPADAQPSHGVWISFGAILAAFSAVLAVWAGPGSDARWVCGAIAGAALVLMVLWPGLLWLHRRRHVRWLQRVGPVSESTAAQPPAAAAA